MAICHTQNVMPSSPLQRERPMVIKEVLEQKWMDLVIQADAHEASDQAEAYHLQRSDEQDQGSAKGVPRGFGEKRKPSP